MIIILMMVMQTADWYTFDDNVSNDNIINDSMWMSMIILSSIVVSLSLIIHDGDFNSESQ